VFGERVARNPPVYCIVPQNNRNNPSSMKGLTDGFEAEMIESGIAIVKRPKIAHHA